MVHHQFINNRLRLGMKKTLSIILLFAIGSAVSADQAKDKRKKRDQDTALEASKKGEVIAYKQVRQIVRNRKLGKLVGQRLRRTNQGWIYELRLRQTAGRVVFVRMDAKTGEILTIVEPKK